MRRPASLTNARRSPATVIALLAAGAFAAAAACSTTTTPGSTPKVGTSEATPGSTRAAADTPAAVSAVAGTWNRLPEAPLARPIYPGLTVSVWTGSQMIVHGIHASATSFSGVTFAYRPGTNRWTRLPNGPRPLMAQGGDAAVWTGSQMLVLGLTAAAYRPATNTWRPIARPAVPPSGIAGWTGHEALAWQGTCCGDTTDSAEAYNPVTNTWRVLKSPLARRVGAMGAWTGKLLVVAGGVSEPGNPRAKVFRDGAAYDPATNRWRRLAPMPQRRAGGTAVWDGKEVLFLGGNAPGVTLPSLHGMAYDPATNRWRVLPAMQFRRQGFAAVRARGRVLVWGGQYRQDGKWVTPPHGEAYILASNRWTALPVSPLHGRQDPAAAWTGRSMLVWGGYDNSPTSLTVLLDGAAFTPRVP